MRAQRQATKQTLKGRPKVQGSQKKHDVVGGAKGQGQSSEVLRNRAYKEKNKSRNRKAMSDKKRKA